jgi:hypothetical protein
MDLSEQLRIETSQARLHDSHVHLYVLHGEMLRRREERARRDVLRAECGLPPITKLPRGAWTQFLRKA